MVLILVDIPPGPSCVRLPPPICPESVCPELSVACVPAHILFCSGCWRYLCAGNAQPTAQHGLLQQWGEAHGIMSTILYMRSGKCSKSFCEHLLPAAQATLNHTLHGCRCRQTQ